MGRTLTESEMDVLRAEYYARKALLEQQEINITQTVPSGGDTGEVLVKTGSLNWEVDWEAVTGGLPDQTGESGKFLTTDGAASSWAAVPGGGDMLTSSYDPTGIIDDVFDMENMVEGTSSKIFTSIERSQLAALSSASSTTTTQLLTEWSQGKDYEMLAITRDTQGRITSSTVKWPDTSTGAYTATNYNTTHEVYDGFTIYHTDSSLTVTQSAVARNIDGAIISKPPLTVA